MILVLIINRSVPPMIQLSQGPLGQGDKGGCLVEVASSFLPVQPAPAPAGRQAGAHPLQPVGQSGRTGGQQLGQGILGGLVAGGIGKDMAGLCRVAVAKKVV